MMEEKGRQSCCKILRMSMAFCVAFAGVWALML
jgi:hypothetical protein